MNNINKNTQKDLNLELNEESVEEGYGSSSSEDLCEKEENDKKRRSRVRMENSLGELTKNFLNNIRQQNKKEIDINDLVGKLGVKKRRIYDITNVLEGIKIFFFSFFVFFFVYLLYFLPLFAFFCMKLLIDVYFFFFSGLFFFFF